MLQQMQTYCFYYRWLLWLWANSLSDANTTWSWNITEGNPITSSATVNNSSACGGEKKVRKNGICWRRERFAKLEVDMIGKGSEALMSTGTSMTRASFCGARKLTVADWFSKYVKVSVSVSLIFFCFFGFIDFF